MIKKIVSFSIGFGLMMGATMAPAFAAVNCSNLTTGPSSLNICNSMLSKIKTLGLTNYGTISHFVMKNVVSGNNTTNNNTSATGMSIGSGIATATVTSQAVLNASLIAVNMVDPTADHIGTNNVTGPSSNNTVNVTNNKTVTLNISNNGTITHNITVNAISGQNNANGNTIVGGVTTGNASSDTTVTSDLNSTVITVDM